MKTKSIFIIIFSLIALVIACSSHSLQPSPRGGGWYRCPHCQGYGVITYSDYGNSTETVDQLKANKEKQHTDSSCLFDIFTGGMEELDDDNRISDKNVIKEYEDKIDSKNYKSNISRNPGSATRTRQCPTCHGIGWVRWQ